MATTTNDCSSLPNFSNSRRSYASVLKQDSAPSTSYFQASRAPVHRKRFPFSDLSSRCYRCGDGGHIARNCKDPVRCFRSDANGHKKNNCSTYSRAAPVVSKASLAQVWCSMILQDDSSFRGSVFDSKELNDEQFLFSLNYLKLRSCLLSPDPIDYVTSVRLLDGLFNSNYKISSFASFMLDEAYGGKVLYCDNKSKLSDSSSDFSYPDISVEEVPEERLCRQPPLSNDSPSGPDVLRPVICEALPLDPSSNVLGGCFLDADVHPGGSGLASLSPLKDVAQVLPVMNSVILELDETVTTKLILYNYFEPLGCCLEDVLPVPGVGCCTFEHSIVKPATFVTAALCNATDDAVCDKIFDSGKMEDCVEEVNVSSAPLSFEAFAWAGKGVMLLDPVVVNLSHFTTHFGAPSVPVLSTSSCSLDLRSNAGKFVQNVSREMDDGYDNLCSTAVESSMYADDTLHILPVSCAVFPVIAKSVSCTELTLFNNLDLLDCCLDDEVSSAGMGSGVVGSSLEFAVSVLETDYIEDCSGDVMSGGEAQHSLAHIGDVSLIDAAASVGPTSGNDCSAVTLAASVGSLESGRPIGLDLGVTLGCAPPVVLVDVNEIQKNVVMGAFNSSSVYVLDNEISCGAAFGGGDLQGPSGFDIAPSQLVFPTVQDGFVDSNATGVVGTGEVTPTSGRRRGRKKKGFYECSAVRRSARLGGSSDRSGGGLPESGAIGIADSGTGMMSFMGSTYSPCALNILSTSDMHYLARNSSFTFDDIQLDTDFIRARELERVNSLGL